MIIAAVTVLPLMVGQQARDEVREVVRVHADVVKCLMRAPELLVAEIHTRAGNTPVV